MTTSVHAVPPHPIREMLAAIDLEIAAVSEKNRARFVAVHHGVRLRQAGPGATYRFRCEAGEHLRDDERIIGSFDEARADGFVVGRTREHVTVALLADLGPRLPHGRLVIDNTFLWKALKQRLQSHASGHRAIDVLTGMAAAQTGLRAPVDPAKATLGLNAEQAHALELALGSATSFIFGPPGTGKTFTLERIVADGFHAHGESTLYTGPTNKVVDLGLRRVIERLRSLGQLDAALDASAIVRIGPISDPELATEFGDRVGLDALVAKREERIAALVTRLADARVALLEPAARERGAAAAARERKLAHLDRRIDVLEQQSKDARRLILARALIVATTAHRVMLPGQVERTFDAVVLDEAAATALPVACCAATRASRYLVCAGDPYQLPAVHTSPHPAVKEWLRRDVFHASGVVDAYQQHGRARGLACLTTQHRFDAPIADLANHITYKQAPLVTHAGLMRRPVSRSPWGSDSILLLDTSALRPFLRASSNGGSRWNPVHASCVRYLLDQLEASGHIPADPDHADAVAILTPYRAQREVLRERLPDTVLTRGCSVSTVHTYQGDEAGTVILDMVDARGLATSRFLRATTRSCTGARLFNVACTRARRRLIVVCDIKHVMRHAARGPVRDFVDYLRVHATRIHLPLAHAHRALAFVHRWEQRGGR